MYFPSVSLCHVNSLAVSKKNPQKHHLPLHSHKFTTYFCIPVHIWATSTVSPHWSLCWQYNLSTPSSLLSVSEPLLTLSRSSFWPPVVMHTWPGICLCKCMNEWNVSNSHVCTQQACRKRVIQDRWTHLFPQHELLNPLLPNKRFLKKKQPANYLSAISSLKLIIPPSVRTNLSSCVYTWMPVYNSCGECLHYLCMRLL